MTKKLRAPSHLATSTREWWRSVIQNWHLEPHHIRLLTLAAESFDRAAECRRVIQKEGLISKDRYGQPRLHPAADEERRAKALFATLLKQLNLDVGDPEAEEEKKRITGSKYFRSRMPGKPHVMKRAWLCS